MEYFGARTVLAADLPFFGTGSSLISRISGYLEVMIHLSVFLELSKSG